MVVKWSEKLKVEDIFTPRHLVEKVRSIPGTIGKSGILDLGGWKIISLDLFRFNCKLFLLAHISMCWSSESVVCKFDEGIIR
jgi:hypothetical protein